jgi:hypothetical protein
MAVYITHRRMVGGTQHEHIASVMWRNTQSAETGTSTRETMVDWIENKGGAAFVQSGTAAVKVLVVKASPPYLRTYADGVWTDNLLALPEF